MPRMRSNVPQNFKGTPWQVGHTAVATICSEWIQTKLWQALHCQSVAHNSGPAFSSQTE